MSDPAPTYWVDRYRAVSSSEVIRQRCTVRGARIESLTGRDVEGACSLFEAHLKSVFLASDRVVEIIRAEIERAAAHAAYVYQSSTDASLARHQGDVDSAFRSPTLIAGPAGAGKSELRRAIGRLLSERTVVRLDDSYQQHELESFAAICVGGHKGVAQILRCVASPGRRDGRLSPIPTMILDCASWLRWKGTCLLGLDETQFMAQSTNASTLIVNTLLAVGSLSVPWFCIANYSMCAKLLDRPPETTQRLLSRPVLLLPDGPDSVDWLALMSEFDVVLNGQADFKCVARAAQLWTLTAGNRRELVNLLVNGLRLSCSGNHDRLRWQDIETAYHSIQYFASRRDIELLIAHAGQGGALPRHLGCPFKGKEFNSAQTNYSESLRTARKEMVSKATISAAMTGTERAAIDVLTQTNETTSKVVSMRSRTKITAESLTKAGQERIKSIGESKD